MEVRLRHERHDDMSGRRPLAMLWSNPLSLTAVIALLCIILVTLFAPLIAPHDPLQISPSIRLQPPSEAHPLGTDAYGRDLWSRLLYGGRISLVVGIGAALISAVAGLALGLVSGFFRWLDPVIMRAMDAVLAIPNILLAIAIVALWGGNLATVLIGITIPEIPRVTRLVRSIVLSAREEPYVEAATVLGTSAPKMLWRHLMPNAFGPLIVQATFICGWAILLESILSFLGAGISPEIPTWGNLMADGRPYMQLRPSMILWPGLLLSVTILSVNILGDTASDMLDPRRTHMRSREQ